MVFQLPCHLLVGPGRLPHLPGAKITVINVGQDRVVSIVAECPLDKVLHQVLWNTKSPSGTRKTAVMLIPTIACGRVVGARGHTIQRLAHLSGASIQVKREGMLQEHQRVEITGQLNMVVAAILLVKEVVAKCGLQEDDLQFSRTSRKATMHSSSAAQPAQMAPTPAMAGLELDDELTAPPAPPTLRTRDRDAYSYADHLRNFIAQLDSAVMEFNMAASQSEWHITPDADTEMRRMQLWLNMLLGWVSHIRSGPAPRM